MKKVLNKRLKSVTDLFAINRLFLIAILLSLILVLTPLYGIGYIIFSVAFAIRLRVIKAFDSYFANFIIVTLIMMASIMISGIFTSIINIPNLAIINLLFSLLFCSIIYHFQTENVNDRKIFDKSDIVSGLPALIIPIAILGLQFVSAPLDVALFKLANADGWDNVAHLNMLQMVSENRNYFYSTSPLVEGSERAYNNYPQGWHLASGNLVNGIVPGVFNPTNYSLNTTLGAYVITSFTWLALAIYTFSKVAWSLTPKLKIGKSKTLRYVSFFVAMLLPVLALFITAVASGYINYLGLIPFVVLITAASYQLLQSRDKKDVWVYLTFTLPLVAGVCLMWVLPTPPLLVLIFATALITGVKARELVRKPLVCLVTLIVGVSLIAYLYILTQDVGLSQISVNTTWLEHFPTVALVLACLALITVYVIVNKIKHDNLVIVLSPFIIYIFAIWAMAYFLDEKIGYYHAKLFGIFFVIVALFTFAAIIKFTESINISSSTKFVGFAITLVVSLSLVSTLFIAAGTNIDTRLFQRNQHYLGKNEQMFVVDWMASDDSLKEDGQILLMRENILDNKNKAMLYNRVSLDASRRFLANSSPSASQYIDDKYTCIIDIYYEERDGHVVIIKDKNKVLRNLSNCLKKRDASGLNTTIRVPFLLESEMQKINTYNTHLIYYDEI